MQHEDANNNVTTSIRLLITAICNGEFRSLEEQRIKSENIAQEK